MQKVMSKAGKAGSSSSSSSSLTSPSRSTSREPSLSLSPPPLLLGGQQTAIVPVALGGAGRMPSAGPSRRHQVSAYVVAVQNAIRLREEYIQRLHEHVHLGGWRKLQDDIGDLLDLLRQQTVDVVARIRDWQQYIGKPKPFTHGVFPNYVLSMPHSMDFLQDIPGFEEWLGFPSRRNPLILPHGAQLLSATRLPHYGLVPIQQAGGGGGASRSLAEAALARARGDGNTGYVFLPNVEPAALHSAAQAMLAEERLFGVWNPHKGALARAQVAAKLQTAFRGHRNFLTRRASSSVREFEKTMKLVGLRLLPNEWDWLRRRTQQAKVGPLPLGHVSHAAVLALVDGTDAGAGAAGGKRRQGRGGPPGEGAGAEPASGGGRRRFESSSVEAMFALPGTTPSATTAAAAAAASARERPSRLPQFELDQAVQAQELAAKRKARADSDVQRCTARVEQLQADLAEVQRHEQQHRQQAKQQKQQQRRRQQQQHQLALVSVVASPVGVTTAAAANAKKAVRFRRKQLRELVREAEAMLDQALQRRHELTVALLHAGARQREARKALRASQENVATMTELVATQRRAAAKRSLGAQGGLERFKRAEARRLARIRARAAEERRGEELAEARLRWARAKLVKKQLIKARGRADAYADDLCARALLSPEDDRTIRKWTVKASYLLVSEDKKPARGNRRSITDEQRQHSPASAAASTPAPALATPAVASFPAAAKPSTAGARPAPNRGGQATSLPSVRRARVIRGVPCLVRVHCLLSEHATDDQRGEEARDAGHASGGGGCASDGRPLLEAAMNRCLRNGEPPARLAVRVMCLEAVPPDPFDDGAEAAKAVLAAPGAELSCVVVLDDGAAGAADTHRWMLHAANRVDFCLAPTSGGRSGGDSHGATLAVRVDSSVSSGVASERQVVALQYATPMHSGGGSGGGGGRGGVVVCRGSVFVALAARRDHLGHCHISAEQVCLPTASAASSSLHEGRGDGVGGAARFVGPGTRGGQDLLRRSFVVPRWQLHSSGLGGAALRDILRACFLRFDDRPACPIGGDGGSGGGGGSSRVAGGDTDDAAQRAWAAASLTGLPGGPTPQFPAATTGPTASVLARAVVADDDGGGGGGGATDQAATTRWSDEPLELEFSTAAVAAAGGGSSALRRRAVQLRVRRRASSTFRCSRSVAAGDDAASSGDAASNVSGGGDGGGGDGGDDGVVSNDEGGARQPASWVEGARVLLLGRVVPELRTVVVTAELVLPGTAAAGAMAGSCSSRVTPLRVPLADEFWRHPTNVEAFHLPAAQWYLARAACDAVEAVVVDVAPGDPASGRVVLRPVAAATGEVKAKNTA